MSGENEQEIISLPSYIDTSKAHECFYKWVEDQSGEQFAREVFNINRLNKKYYGCICFWFRTKGASKTDTVIAVPGSDMVPDALIKLSGNYDYTEQDDTDRACTEITADEDEAEEEALRRLKNEHPEFFGEDGELKNTKLLASFHASIPVWEGTYSVKYGKEHKFFIDAQTGEASGENCSDKEKNSILKSKQKKAKKQAPAPKSEDSADQQTPDETVPETEEETEEDIKEAEEAKKRYILISLIIIALIGLMLVINMLLNIGKTPKTPANGKPAQTSNINAKSKPKFDPKSIIRKEEKKEDLGSAESFANGLINSIKMRNFPDIYGKMVSENEKTSIVFPEASEGFEDITNEFDGSLEHYFEHTSAIFPEGKAKLIKEETSEIQPSELLDGTDSESSAKPEGKKTVKIAIVESSFIESGNWSDNPDAPETRNRQICRFTLIKRDKDWKICRVEEKNETPSEEDIEKVIGKTEQYSQVEENKSGENKEEEKPSEPSSEPQSNTGSDQTAQEPQEQIQTSSPEPPQTSSRHEEEYRQAPPPPPREKPQFTLPPSPKPEPRAASSATEGSDSGSAGGSVE